MIMAIRVSTVRTAIPQRLPAQIVHQNLVPDNQSSLQQEFGLGDPYQPTGKLAAALAAYERMLA